MSAATDQFAHVRQNEPLLNERQRRVLDLLVAGKTNGEIGEALGITLDGAKWNVSEILGKLGLESREDAAEYWRWRSRPAGKVAALRGLLGLGTLKWVGGGVAIIAAVAVVSGLLSRGEERGSGELPPFYLEARVEILDASRTIGTNIAGGSGTASALDRRVARVRWWNRDIDHMRVEIETLEPALEAGTDIIVLDGDNQFYYRQQTNTYSKTPIFDFPDEAKARVRPWNFSLFIGPWMTEVEDLADVMEQLRSFGGQDDVPRTVEVVGHERVLGVMTTIVEYSAAGSSSGPDGATHSGSIRYWIDEERLVVLRQVVDRGELGHYLVEVTRLDWDTSISGSRFEFKPPKDSEQIDEDSGSQSGSIPMTPGPR